MRTIDWKDAGAAFSLANLFNIAAWKDLVFTGWHHYYRPAQPSILEHLAILLDVILLTLVFLGALACFRSSRTTIKFFSQSAFLALGILALGPLSHELVKWLSPETERFLNFYVPVGVLLVCAALALREKQFLPAAAGNLRQFALFLLPFSLLIFLKIGWDQANAEPGDFLPQTIHRPASKNAPRPGPKVVWIVFDELDFGLLTAAARKGTDLKDLNRLSEQSFVAANAFAPNNRTQESIPSLLTGIPVKEAFTVSPDELMLQSSDQQTYSLRKSPNIFTELEDRGRRSAIVGWYHPYCRVFDDGVSECYWSPLASPDCAGFAKFTRCSQRTFLQALAFVPFATRVFPTLAAGNSYLQGETSGLQAARNEFLTSKMKELLARPRPDLLFLHSSVPHLPVIGRRQSDDEDIYSAFEIVNDTIRDIRTILEERGKWDDTVVIVSSDHASRLKTARDLGFLAEAEKQVALSDQRIPFMVKLAGQKTRAYYQPTLNTIITKKLILDIFDGKVRDPEELLSWLEEIERSEPDLAHRKNVGRKW